MLPTLTVHEPFLDCALLRSPKEMSKTTRAQKVDNIERQLSVYDIRNSIIVAEESASSISGNGKRRLAIACEMVISPSDLFFDEPVSGPHACDSFHKRCLLEMFE